MCVPTKLSLFASKPGEPSSPIGGNFQSAGKMLRKNLKGRDIGYALAADSCEGVDDVETCTVTAPDAITAFAVPNLNGRLAAPSIFSGPAVQQVALPVPITQPTSVLATFIFCQPFRPST